jgi:MFS family permease
MQPWVKALLVAGWIAAGITGLALFIIFGGLIVSMFFDDVPAWDRAGFVFFFIAAGIPGVLFAWRCFFGPARPRTPVSDAKAKDDKKPS